MPQSHWQKSSYSEEASSCLYLAASPSGKIHLRESDTPETVLVITRQRLHPLISGTKTGHFDRAGALAP
ncbi:DUF397 domain-containing protein [Streptomyces sp. NPDC026206]|uniref:DUF397 domain-containing protein n=1 Tax=Streptomyces sp. NPDC026206 TaxID=3157089 RepID=UPI00340F55D4